MASMDQLGIDSSRLDQCTANMGQLTIDSFCLHQCMAKHALTGHTVLFIYQYMSNKG